VGITPVAAPYAQAILVATAEGSDLTVLDAAQLTAANSPSTQILPLGSGFGERLSWSAIGSPHGAVTLTSSVSPSVIAEGTAPGSLIVRALYVRGGHTNPYECELRLKPALDLPGTVIRKDQYDLLMNLLSTLHPIGVEIRTRNIREHVVEVRDGQLDAFPPYTYPSYRTDALDWALAAEEA
jgi:hypothetical protein